MTTPFQDALGDAQTEVTGMLTSALPVVAVVAAAFLGIKYTRRIIRGL